MSKFELKLLDADSFLSEMGKFDGNQDPVALKQKMSFFVAGRLSSSDYFIDCSTTEGILKAYKRCDVLRTVISKSSQAIANLKVWAVDKDGKEVTTPQAKNIIDKLMRPNPYEDFKRFFKKLDAQTKLFGKAYVYKQKAVAYKGEMMYYIIPYQMVTPVYKNSTNLLFEREVEKYRVITGSTTYKEISPKDIHIFYDVSLNTKDNNTIFGGSRLESLSEVVTTYSVLWEVSSELYANRGALNLISMGVNNPELASMPMLGSEKDSLLKRLKERYGMRRGQNKNIVVTTDAKVHQLTAKIQEMNIDRMLIESKKAIGSSYDVPAPLLDIESSRYKNMTEAQKNLYTNAAIPTAEYFFSEWLQMTGVHKLDFEIKADYSHLEFYQDAKREEAIAFQQMALAVVPLVDRGIISDEQARIKLDLQ